LFEVGKCNHWKRRESFGGVTQPNLIKLYNEKMGNVDLFDKLTALYCIWTQSWIREVVLAIG